MLQRAGLHKAVLHRTELHRAGLHCNFTRESKVTHTVSGVGRLPEAKTNIGTMQNREYRDGEDINEWNKDDREDDSHRDNHGPGMCLLIDYI